MILSIDVGIKNLAMCLIDPTTLHIEQWDVSGVPPEHEDGLFACLNRHLNERPWILDARTVLIEKQPGQNKRMKSVEHFLHAYCIIRNTVAETIIYDARHKVPDCAGSGRERYKQRKAMSVTRCKDFLDETDTNKEWREHFRASKKKDDLADTVLQALSFIRRSPATTTPVKKTTTVITPRRPTENQKETKYSKSNLMWLLNNTPLEKLKTDKRFLKDLGRYFTSIDDLRSHIKKRDT